MPPLLTKLMVAAQITAAPEFQSGTTFQTDRAASTTIDGTSHVAAEQARINDALFARLRRLPGHEAGARLIEAKLLSAAIEHYRKNGQPVGAAVAQYLSGMVEVSGKQLLAQPRNLAVLPFLGETIGTAPGLTDAMLGAIREIAQTHPEHAEAQYYLARAFSKQPEPPEGEIAQILRRAADLDPKSTRPLLDLAKRQSGGAAIATLEEMLKREPVPNKDAATAHYRLAGLYRAAGQPEKGLEHMRAFQKRSQAE